MKKVGRFSLFELQGDSSVIDKASQKTFVGGGSGSSTDPYTQEEFDSMMYSGHWNGGFVYGMGWVTPQVYIYSSRYNYAGGYHPSGHGVGWPDDTRDLVDYNSTRWGQGGAIRSNYFSYNGKEVQWTVVNGTAAANNYRQVFSLATSNLVQDPDYNNYEIQIKYDEGGTALRLQTKDYNTYMALLDAVGYP